MSTADPSSAASPPPSGDAAPAGGTSAGPPGAMAARAKAASAAPPAAPAAESAPDAKAAPPAGLESQTYEIIRKRLLASGEELRARLAKLNDARRDVFGSIETTLTGTERVTTDNNCVPRDMVAVGERFLFGYNVHLGLRSETKLADVFAQYEFREGTFHQQPLDLLNNEQFLRDFQGLYKYYKNTEFAKFAVRGQNLFMVFRVGKGIGDIKTFKFAFAAGGLTYLDNRSDHEFSFPPQHEFTWQRTRREQHRYGAHPHISIEDRVFVETVGGDLTIKVENNTETGAGIYSEQVDNRDQTLDDAEIQYAIVGNLVLLKILPYQEKQYRHFVYNAKLQQARRIDSVADACVLLPDDHGLVFSNGYYLQTGEFKTFETNVAEAVFSKRIASPNGEDTLYVFYNRLSGTYVLLSYNLIAQEVSTPTICNGYAFFPDGKLITFRGNEEPQKHHAIQIWQTPYVGADFVPATKSDSLLYKIGNRDLVRAMAECHEILNLLGKDDAYANLYLDLVKQATDLVDTYFWIGNDEAFRLKEPLVEIRTTAAGAISEFEKVVRVRRSTRAAIERASSGVAQLVKSIHAERFETIDVFVRVLAGLRGLRGEIISLRDLRYADLPAIDKLEVQVREHTEQLSQRCVEFLLQPEALAPYEARVDAEQAQIPSVTKVAEAKELEQRIGAAAGELELLIEIVSNLKIDDATQRTEIIDRISTIFSRVNQSRAALKNRMSELAAAEGAAEFHSQLKLLGQSVVSYLDVCDDPAKCEEFLTKVMIQVEELEGRFAEFDEFLEQLAEKREEIHNAFEARRLALVEGRNRRASSLMKSAERILKGCKTRVESLQSVQEINGYFASDLMVEKVRDIVRQLAELNDSVKVDDIQGRLKTIREDAVRQLKDRQELFVDGQNIIQLGKHKFSVNVQALDLTTVVRDEQMCFHLTGTNFFEPIADDPLSAARDAWSQEVVSETPDVYRAEYLAYLILNSAGRDEIPPVDGLVKLSQPELLALVQKFMAPRYSEGYVKGVHDHDAALILRALAELKSAIGLLRYSSRGRSLAWLFWLAWHDDHTKTLLAARIAGFGKIRHVFTGTTTQAECIAELRSRIEGQPEIVSLFDAQSVSEAAEFLFHALADAGGFPIGKEANDLFHALQQQLDAKAYADAFAKLLAAVRKDPLQAFALARDWIRALVAEHGPAEHAEYADEAALLLLDDRFDETRVIHTSVARELSGMSGSHPRIAGGQYRLHFNGFTTRLRHFSEVVVARFLAYTHRKHELVDAFREELRLEEFRPRVLTSFVRNKLIDKVYLPLIGDNLAKQIGVAGEAKRTDRMGLLLVVSPPGYGKTTLMEYIANRLGIIFMKINGPAIGHDTTSLDPAAAPNASAREEVEKLNLALEMGDNVMLYLDDIQHCNAELLQKFISLCDAQRKIEGVYKGRTRTYDLRGRKVCVVMAGNPYTESGEKFQIPDMLANRADTYNLGEIIGDSADVFEMSYLENALTSNSTLANVANRNPKDVYAIIKMAASDDQANGPVDLEANYSLDELAELTTVMKKLMRVRDVVLAVNREYIRSAAQSDDYRTEPAFKLQGSYRNMNKIAEKISPIMNDRELELLIWSHYENDAQTLTTGAEANLLKLREILGTLTPDEARRWDDIKRTFQQNVKLKGVGSDDKIGLLLAQLSTLGDGLHAIKDTLAKSADQLAAASEDSDDEDGQGTQQLAQAIAHLGDFRAGLDAISQALTGGVATLSKQPKTAPKLTATFDAKAVAALTQLTGASNGAETGSTEAGSTVAPTGKGGKSAALPTQKIHIVNKVPPVILGIIREQFKLMEAWLKPLAEASTDQTENLTQIRTQLEAALKHYNQMIGELSE